MKKPTIRKSVKHQLLYQWLVNQYPKAVEAQVRRVRIYGYPPEDLEDFRQDLWTGLFRGIHYFKPKMGVKEKTFVETVLTHRAIDLWRRSKASKNQALHISDHW